MLLHRMLAGELRLKTLDLLHVSTASVMGAEEFATLDRDIIKKGDKVEELTGIRIVH